MTRPHLTCYNNSNKKTSKPSYYCYLKGLLYRDKYANRSNIDNVLPEVYPLETRVVKKYRPRYQVGTEISKRDDPSISL